MKHIKDIDGFLFEMEGDAETWYHKLARSYKEYQDDENSYHNPDGDWEEEDKFWIFDEPVHEILQKNGSMGIIPGIDGIVKNFGGSEAELLHYMNNDFSLDYDDKILFSFSGISRESKEEVVLFTLDVKLEDGQDSYTELIIRTGKPIDFSQLENFTKMSKGNEAQGFLHKGTDINNMLIDIHKIVKGELG